MKFKKLHLTITLCLYAFVINAQDTVQYKLFYSENSSKVAIEVYFKSIEAKETVLMIPRSAPGTYELTDYSAFVGNVKAITNTNKTINGTLGMGSFFIFNSSESLQAVTYEVDIKKMEQELLGAYASSKLRNNYLGILGYSVFGFIEGLENKPIKLELQVPKHWPIFSTLQPSVNRKKGKATYEVANFSLLADAQYLLGNDVKVQQVNNAPIPFYIAAYSEAEINIEEIGRRGLLALNGLNNYFGFIPMPHYTICYEFIKPISNRHDYGFSMEHLNSMTASMPITKAIKTFDPKANIGSTIHHIGHSWLPLRSYGTGYKPFEWQTAPLIETIWLNEGFIWYISYYHVLNRKPILNFFKKILNSAPGYIKEKSLKDLSLLGSTQYSLDFRIGRNLFSRGALLAYELDEKIKKDTNNAKSFKDVIIGLMEWTKKHKRAFNYNEIESIISKSVGVDVSDVWKKWQKPLN